MTHILNNHTQIYNKLTNINLSIKIKSYLLKMKNIENAKTLNLLKHTKQIMKTLKIKMVTSKRKFVKNPLILH